MAAMRIIIARFDPGVTTLIPSDCNNMNVFTFQYIFLDLGWMNLKFSEMHGKIFRNQNVYYSSMKKLIGIIKDYVKNEPFLNRFLILIEISLKKGEPRL